MSKRVSGSKGRKSKNRNQRKPRRRSPRPERIAAFFASLPIVDRDS